MMNRKSLLGILIAAVVFVLSGAVYAQDLWQSNRFTADYERFYYEIVSNTTEWDYDLFEEVKVENRFNQLLELKKADDGLVEVTQGYSYMVPQDQLSDQLSFMGGMFGLPMFLGGGEWLGEWMFLAMFASELELEVGNTMQLFDGSRVRVVDEETVAGVRGYVVLKFYRETDEDGNRIDVLTSEWVIAPDVGWPLRVNVFQEDEVVYSMTLLEYERK